MTVPAPFLSLPLASIRVGKPQELPVPGAASATAKPWVTALVKEPIGGPVWLDTLNLAGDAQAHLQSHGGPDQPLCVYPGSHYAYWAARLGRDLPAGSFGENLTLSGSPTEHDVCLGDIFRFGEAVVQISQPRSPCYQLARRWQTPQLPKWLQDSGRTGWYMRVLQPGRVAPTDSLDLLARPHPEWPIPLVNSVKYELRENRALVQALAECPALGEFWRRKMQGRLSGALPLYDDANRLEGLPNS